MLSRSKNIFNYMLIEASGVSEPAQIAPLFELCDDEHDHEAEHKEGPELGEVARLDTCVTVVDAAEFYNNLETMKTYEDGDIQGTIAELMIEQVEYSNVIVLNKEDLVTEEQQKDILHRIELLNPKAKVLKSFQSKIDVMQILNTRLFNPRNIEEPVMIDTNIVKVADKAETDAAKSCCEKSWAEEGKKCCKVESKSEKIVASGLSQVLLGVVANNNSRQRTRHEVRFGITSFVYRARRPFHPVRLYDSFLEPYFMLRYQEEEGPETRDFKIQYTKKKCKKILTQIPISD